MSFRITPSLGPDVDQVLNPNGYWFRDGTVPSYQLGAVVTDDGGAQCKFARAGSSPITANAQVVIDADGIATAGSGGWWAKASIPANAYFHAVDYDPDP